VRTDPGDRCDLRDRHPLRQTTRQIQRAHQFLGQGRKVRGIDCVDEKPQPLTHRRCHGWDATASSALEVKRSFFAVAGLRREFGFSDDLAWTVTDQQLMTFTAERLAGLRARIAALIGEDTAASDDPKRP